MKKNTVKLINKIHLLKFLKKNNIKDKYFGIKNIYFDSIGSINDLSKNSLTFYEKKYSRSFKKNLEKKFGIIITDDKDIYKFKRNIILSEKPRELFIKISKRHEILEIS